MVITYHGDNYFKLQAGNLSILVNPTNLRSVKGADATISTIKPSPLPRTDETVWIDNQGEYEVKGIQIRGWGNDDGRSERTIYLVEMDEMKIALLTNLTKEPEEKVSKLLKDSDIVIIGTEKKSSLKDDGAAKFLRTIRPPIIILGSGEPKAFLKEFKKNTCDKMDKLVVKKKDVSQNETKIICLKG